MTQQVSNRPDRYLNEKLETWSATGGLLDLVTSSLQRELFITFSKYIWYTCTPSDIIWFHYELVCVLISLLGCPNVRYQLATGVLSSQRNMASIICSGFSKVSFVTASPKLGFLFPALVLRYCL